jgi:ketosteroid isomerase-like protein
MSQENVENLARAQAAYNRGDWDTALATMDQSVVFDLTRVAPDGQIYEGHEGVKAFWQMLRDVFGDFRTDPEEVIDGGDKLFARMHLRGSGQASGAAGEDFLYQVVTLRRSRAVRVDFFRDRGEALRAAGLSEQDAHADS